MKRFKAIWYIYGQPSTRFGPAFVDAVDESDAVRIIRKRAEGLGFDKSLIGVEAFPHKPKTYDVEIIIHKEPETEYLTIEADSIKDARAKANDHVGDLYASGVEIHDYDINVEEIGTE